MKGVLGGVGGGFTFLLGAALCAGLLSLIAFSLQQVNDPTTGTRTVSQQSNGTGAFLGGVRVWVWQHAHPLWAYLEFEGGEKDYHASIGEGSRGHNGVGNSSAIEQLQQQRVKDFATIQKLEGEVKLWQSKSNSFQQTLNMVATIAGGIILLLCVKIYLMHKKIVRAGQFRTQTHTRPRRQSRSVMGNAGGSGNIRSQSYQ